MSKVVEPDFESALALLNDQNRSVTVPCDMGKLTVFRQAGGCLEINQMDAEGEQDIVHVCQSDLVAWHMLIRAMEEVFLKVPVRF